MEGDISQDIIKNLIHQFVLLSACPTWLPLHFKNVFAASMDSEFGVSASQFANS